MSNPSIYVIFTESGGKSLRNIMVEPGGTRSTARINWALSEAALDAPDYGLSHRTEVLVKWGAGPSERTCCCRIDLVRPMASSTDVLGDYLRQTARWAQSELDAADVGTTRYQMARSVRDITLSAIGALTLIP